MILKQLMYTIHFKYVIIGSVRGVRIDKFYDHFIFIYCIDCYLEVWPI